LALRMTQDVNLHNPHHMGTNAALSSRLTKPDIQTLMESGLMFPINANDVSNWAIASTVDEPSKNRRRPVFDTLPANVLLADSPKVPIPPMRQWMQQLIKCAHAAEMDFKGWYYQIPIDPIISTYFSIKTGSERNPLWYALNHAPMGHKWSVFIGHTITKVLAYDPLIETDIIIDNVLAAHTEQYELEHYTRKFSKKCDFVGATLGEEPKITQTVTHRGVELDLINKTIRLKPKFIEKLRLRWGMIETDMTIGQWFSLIGMVSWAHSVLRLSVTVRMLALWKISARLAMEPPHVNAKLTAKQKENLAAVIQEVLMNTPQTYNVAPTHRSLVITDAHKQGVKAAWGAAIIGKGDAALVLQGRFPISDAKKSCINELN